MGAARAAHSRPAAAARTPSGRPLGPCRAQGASRRPRQNDRRNDGEERPAGQHGNFAAATDHRGVAIANSAGSASSTNSRPKLHDAAMPTVTTIATDSTWPTAPRSPARLRSGDHRRRLGCGRETRRPTRPARKRPCTGLARRPRQPTPPPEHPSSSGLPQLKLQGRVHRGLCAARSASSRRWKNWCSTSAPFGSSLRPGSGRDAAAQSGQPSGLPHQDAGWTPRPRLRLRWRGSGVAGGSVPPPAGRGRCLVHREPTRRAG